MEAAAEQDGHVSGHYADMGLGAPSALASAKPAGHSTGAVQSRVWLLQAAGEGFQGAPSM